jgi:hypothetical protein
MRLPARPPVTSPRPTARLAAAVLWGAIMLAAPALATPEIFREADLPLGEQLIKEHACAACHVRRVGGDGSAIYRPQGRINTPGALRGMVDMCSVELKLSLFPEEVTAVAAVLNRDHYRFGLAAQPRSLAPRQP